jgi:hypothetical protein
MQMTRLKGLIVLLGIGLLLGSTPATAKDVGLTVKVVLESGQVQAGETLAAAAVVTNNTRSDQIVLVEGFLSPVAEPIRTPPPSRWERFVYEILARISSDWEVIAVKAGETKAVRLDIEVHPRVHGRFDVVATAHTQEGDASGRTSVISLITAPPSNGAVLVHGMVYTLGDCRVLLTDDGHVYEPKGEKADAMFALLDSIYPRPDGVTVLGAILPNTLGCFGVELEIDHYRYDREPGSATGVRWRHLSRGRTPDEYEGPDEEIIRQPPRFREVVEELGAKVTGEKPDFRREMVAAVVIGGSQLATVQFGRIFEKDGTLKVHYTVTNIGPGYEKADVFAETWHMVALPKFAGPVEFVRHDIKVRADADRVGTLEVADSLDLTGVKALKAGNSLDKKLRKVEKARRKSVDRILSADQAK